MNGDGSPFSRRMVVGLVSVVGLSFLAALLWGVFGPELRSDPSAAPDSFSRSAIGHHAFVELLRELGIPVVVSRDNSGAKAGSRALLLIMEPVLGSVLRENMLRRMLRESGRSLVVLPKWEGSRDAERRGWIGAAHRVGEAEIEELLKTIGAPGKVVRGEQEVDIVGQPAVQPTLPQPQLVLSDSLRPMLQAPDRGGILFGRVDTWRRTVYVLSDPDLLSTHGLGRRGNAAAALKILDRVREEGESVVIDETLHGYGREPSLYRALFDFPLVLVMFSMLATVVVLLGAAMRRFGPALPVDPPLGVGKEVLIRNSAALLAVGGHAALAIRRYLDNAVAEVRRRTHVPVALPAGQADEWLDRAATARGLSWRVAALRVEVEAVSRRGDTRRTRKAARHIHRWKEEMIRGRSDHL